MYKSLDNSDWMRNGDYAPSRLDSQEDAGINIINKFFDVASLSNIGSLSAAGLICNDRTGGNPENTVGILTMAGKGLVYRLYFCVP